MLLFLPSMNKGELLAGNRKYSQQARNVIKLLRRASRTSPYFGHQDALMYGQNWWHKESDTLYTKSDIYDVCGKYPYLLGLDLGRIELEGDKNIDGCLFRQMKEAAIKHYERGGFVTISWHMNNPVTGGTTWDCSAGNVIREILSDSLLHQKYLHWLDVGADFINHIVDKKGRKIPVLFRPFHECNMEGFWWSGKSCTADEYIALWKLTFDYFMQEKRMYQLLWVYSPHDIKSEEELGMRYPGDEYVDVIGYERYQLGSITYEAGAERFAKGVSKGIDMTLAFAKPRNKVVAFTETGFPGIPYEKWWTEALGCGIKDKSIAYVLLWRNAKSENYYFGPCKKSGSSPNFIHLVKKQKIKLLSPR